MVHQGNSLCICAATDSGFFDCPTSTLPSVSSSLAHISSPPICPCFSLSHHFSFTVSLPIGLSLGGLQERVVHLWICSLFEVQPCLPFSCATCFISCLSFSPAHLFSSHRASSLLFFCSTSRPNFGLKFPATFSSVCTFSHFFPFLPSISSVVSSAPLIQQFQVLFYWLGGISLWPNLTLTLDFCIPY